MVLATVFALAAAALHAGWNLRVKASDDRFVALWGQFVMAGAVCAAGLVLVGLPARDAWPWLALSALIHVAYVVCLAEAYGAGDFSLAYPLARGGGAMVAAIGGVAFLDDRLTLLSFVAIVVITGGLVSFVRPGTSWDSIRWALLVAVLIGAYTLADAVGARRTEGIAYVLATFVATAITVSAWGLATGHLANLRRSLATSWRGALAGGLASAAAYGLVLYAVRWAPVGYVTALRESSVVLAALAGWRLLAEGFGRARLASATVVATGLVLLVAAR
jgi:drug/metabolite transporter (DMT)-like permease